MKTIIFFCIASFQTMFCAAQSVYTFNGNGNWTNTNNWVNQLIPPNTLPAGSTIFIACTAGDSCILNVTQTISQGAFLIVNSGANLVIAGGVFINNNITNIPEVTICYQNWMTKNLDVDHYRNGDSIPHVTDPAAWASLTSGAWTYYQNDSSQGTIYGKLYNWYAVNDPRGLAPVGWHIPTDNEWTQLTDICLRDLSIAGGAMKDTGTLNWISNTGATNSSGFTGLPGGYLYSYGNSFNFKRFNGYWWSSTQMDSSNSYIRQLYYGDEAAYRSATPKVFGFSVRCVRDYIPSLPSVITSYSMYISSNSANCGGIVSSSGGLNNVRRGIIYSINPISDTNSVIGGGKLIDSSLGVGSFIISLSGLLPLTTYHIRTFAVNSMGVSYGGDSVFTTLSTNLANVPSIGIGNQVWMKKNLSVSSYRNGDAIPEETDPFAWANLTTGAWCWYNNDSVNFSQYGKLYNWYAVHDARGLAPAGWHIPGQSEWLKLTDTCLGVSATSGGKMKVNDTTLWQSPNVGATNISGFSGLPAALRNTNGSFSNIGTNCSWWSSTPIISSMSWFCKIDNDSSKAYVSFTNNRLGFSVRCVLD